MNSQIVHKNRTTSSTLNTVTMSPRFNFLNHSMFFIIIIVLPLISFEQGGHACCWKSLIEASPPYLWLSQIHCSQISLDKPLKKKFNHFIEQIKQRIDWACACKVGTQHHKTPWLCYVGPSIGWAQFFFKVTGFPALWGAFRFCTMNVTTSNYILSLFYLFILLQSLSLERDQSVIA